LKNNVWDTLFRSRGPVSRVEATKLARAIEEDGIGHPSIAVRFVRDISWVLQSSSQAVVVSPKGKVIEECSTFNDFYGFLADVPEIIKEYGTPEKFDLSDYAAGTTVEIRTTVLVTPCLLAPQERQVAYLPGNHYLPIPQDWMLDDAQVEVWIDAMHRAKETHLASVFDEKNLPTYLRDAEITDIMTVWKSSNTPAENASAFAALQAKYSIKEAA